MTNTQTCGTCGIGTRRLANGALVHTEPRTLANRLHNGTRDHNATTSRKDAS